MIYTAEMEARQHFLAQVVIVIQRTPAPAYYGVAVSHGHAGLQQGGQLARPHRLTTPRSTHLSAPVADSLVIEFNFTAVIINSATD